MTDEQLQDPDADWDREDPPKYVDVAWRMKDTGAPVSAEYAARHPERTERVQQDAPADIVIPAEDVRAALADPSTAHLKDGGAAQALLLQLAAHFEHSYVGERPTLVVRR